MINFAALKNEEYVLLVGEGNFTFTISVLTKLAKQSDIAPSSVNLIATCFQKYKDLSVGIKENAHYAYKLGAEIWFGVDATALHHHERFMDHQFDYIIFNFPHVGGKMKLHLNRLLLKNFFLSANVLLKSEGKILVTLCQGQSGTPYDTIKRKHGDSWQIIDMATYADLILSEVYPFSATDWPIYNCNGYRSLEKGFHLSEAHTFVFVKGPLLLECSTILNQDDFNCVHCPYIRNRLKDQQTILDEVHHHFRLLLGAKIKTLKISNNVQTVCLCREDASINWWDMVCEYKEDSNNISCILSCQPCWIDDSASVRKIVLISNVKTECLEPLLNFLYGRCTQRKLKGNSMYESITHLEDIDNVHEVATIFVDKKRRETSIAVYLNEFLQLGSNFVVPELPFPLECNNKSLYPPAHCHHLSMWIPETFSIQHFSCALRFVAGSIIKSFSPIGQYDCPLEKRSSICFRIVYQSLDKALSSKKAFEFQNKVIGPFLETCLGVIIR